MTPRQRLRRVGILCCHCLRNLALYHGGWKGAQLRVDDMFWRSVNSNFIDVAVLEWCKLFADRKGKHHWRKVVSDPDTFRTCLFAKLRVPEAKFNAYVEEMRTLRDKFIAHLDEHETMYIPRLRIARQSAAYLYDYLRAHEEIENCFHDAPASAASFYGLARRQGRQTYSKVVP